MVETITPVVHGGRRSRWALVLLVHTAGAVVAAAVFGGVLAVAGSVLGAPWGAAGVALVAATAGAYLAREAFGVPVPIPQLRRQVPDWWRTFFPFAPAAFLYGLGLGVGFFTYLARGTLVVVAAAAFASGIPEAGALLLGTFGLVRGLTAIVAIRSTNADEGSALVGRLARSSSWSGWRLAHVVVLLLVLAASVAALVDADVSMQLGGLAAAVLAVVFAVAGVAKLVRWRIWRRALSAYGLPKPVERLGAVGVPIAELVAPVLVVLGLHSTAGLASLVLMESFSVAIVLARMRAGRWLECGCFGRTATRDYRVLLVRNTALAAVAMVAWRVGADTPVAEPGMPSGSDLIPAGLAVAGVALAVWVAAGAFTAVRRGSAR
ncbi:MAG: hypothetical protein L0206_23440 [Actinobacteria bacterium]|nr:hypothetical protein [Actinomycetota bacterium]